VTPTLDDRLSAGNPLRVLSPGMFPSTRSRGNKIPQKCLWTKMTRRRRVPGGLALQTPSICSPHSALSLSSGTAPLSCSEPLLAGPCPRAPAQGATQADRAHPPARPQASSIGDVQALPYRNAVSIAISARVSRMNWMRGRVDDRSVGRFSSRAGQAHASQITPIHRTSAVQPPHTFRKNDLGQKATHE
jgi:hypothetical protein